MSQPSPEASSAPDGAVAPALADELIRRAIAIDEARKETVTLAEIKETLAVLGVSARTVERAATEMHVETRESSGLAVTVVGGAGVWLTFSVPGLICIGLALVVGGFWAWVLLWFGGLWTLYMATPFAEMIHDELRLLRRQRGLE